MSTGRLQPIQSSGMAWELTDRRARRFHVRPNSTHNTRSCSAFQRLTEEEQEKVTSRKEIEDCVAEPKTMKISSFQLR
nr:hypothetical protein CFP56_75883 [Quercus suber]